jgi:hypothetical protein
VLSTTGFPPFTPVIRDTRLMPATENCFGLIRTSGPPIDIDFGLAFLPMDVLVVKTLWKTNRKTKPIRNNLAILPSILKGT